MYDGHDRESPQLLINKIVKDMIYKILLDKEGKHDQAPWAQFYGYNKTKDNLLWGIILGNYKSILKEIRFSVIETTTFIEIRLRHKKLSLQILFFE
jgi:hypothetical protein